MPVRNKVKIKRRGDWRKVDHQNFPLVTHLGENVYGDRRRSGRRVEETSS